MQGRDGHRDRIRNAYLNGEYDDAEDTKILELFLSLVVPRKDVKYTVYALFERFEDLEGIFGADIEELVAVNGVGENVAVAIKMFDELMNKKAPPVEYNLNNYEDRIEYAKRNTTIEYRYCVFAIGHDGEPVDCVGFDEYNDDAMKRTMELLTLQSCTGFFIAKFRENEFLPNDIDMIADFKLMSIELNVPLLDYVTVGFGTSQSLWNSKYFRILVV